MSDPREALARLLMSWGCDDESAGIRVGEILAEFLVVPRSAVIGTEYGYRHAPDMPVFKCAGNVDAAIQRVAEIREAQRRRGWGARAEALEQPVLPWTPIPLLDAGSR